MNLKNTILVFLTFSLSLLGVCHENPNSILELNKEGEIVKVFFKTPIIDNSQIEIVFPDQWKETSSFSSVNYNDNTTLFEYTFDVNEEVAPIYIKRNGDHQSPLIISTSTELTRSTDVLLPSVKEWYPPFGKNDSVSTFSNFTLLGIEHILIGFDHLLFVLSLLFLVKRKQLVWAISAFTLAHSITLAISTFHIIELPISVIEALIAFSIVLLALEMAKAEKDKNSTNYIQLAFFFGLLHGFGFASVLSELNSPGNSISIALLAFNFGVEIGQLIFVIAALLIIHLLFKKYQMKVIAQKLSYPIGGIAAFWFLERIWVVF